MTRLMYVYELGKEEPSAADSLFICSKSPRLAVKIISHERVMLVLVSTIVKALSFPFSLKCSCYHIATMTMRTPWNVARDNTTESWVRKSAGARGDKKKKKKNVLSDNYVVGQMENFTFCEKLCFFWYAAYL